MGTRDEGPPGGALVRYWAAARAAAGTAEERLPGATVGEVLAAARAAHGGDGGELARVLARCSVLVDGVRSDPAAPVGPGAVLEVLPPFAGG
ncbi:MoaD/ThiS family protein [Vallicoccus soli]|uniref:MoaD/ThiS family protein n=1 Tax=Vallicoccus soli TaxID=2339232 RepID=A0A3A3Z463_9ACTN|nr:MoaD/ThiS family protein [Vallicoccus soli]RJK97718.1 MoaD/ThiS family protein [Vallicoccus soli]